VRRVDVERASKRWRACAAAAGGPARVLGGWGAQRKEGGLWWVSGSRKTHSPFADGLRGGQKASLSYDGTRAQHPSGTAMTNAEAQRGRATRSCPLARRRAALLVGACCKLPPRGRSRLDARLRRVAGRHSAAESCAQGRKRRASWAAQRASRVALFAPRLTRRVFLGAEHACCVNVAWSAPRRARDARCSGLAERRR
jgi:hypothetical protein